MSDRRINLRFISLSLKCAGCDATVDLEIDATKQPELGGVADWQDLTENAEFIAELKHGWDNGHCRSCQIEIAKAASAA